MNRVRKTSRMYAAHRLYWDSLVAINKAIRGDRLDPRERERIESVFAQVERERDQ